MIWKCFWQLDVCFFLVLFGVSGSQSFFIWRLRFLCPLLCPAYEGPKPSQKSIIFYLKTVFHAFGICRTHGVTNEYLLFENNLVELSGFPHEILSSIWKVFFSTPRISSIWKINSITDYLLFEKWFESPSLNQKSSKTIFTDPPPKARVPKYLRPGPTSGGTLALSSSGGHPGRASMFYWF